MNSSSAENSNEQTSLTGRIESHEGCQCRPVAGISTNEVTGEMDENHILCRLQDLNEQVSMLRLKLSNFEATKVEQRRMICPLESNLDTFVDKLKETRDCGPRNPNHLQDQLNVLKSYTSPTAAFKKLKEFLVEDLEQILSHERQIEDAICSTTSVPSLACTNCPSSMTLEQEDIVSAVKRLAKMTLSIHTEREDLQKRLEEARANHEAELVHIKESMQNEMRCRIEDAIKKCNEENAKKLRETLEQIVQLENSRHEQLAAVKQAIIEQLECKLKETNQLLVEQQENLEVERQTTRRKSNEAVDLQQKLITTTSELDALRAQVKGLQEEAARVRRETEDLCEKRWRKEMDSYREQVKQHARTICVMEERLVKLAQQAKDAKENAQILKRQNAELQAVHNQLISQFKRNTHESRSVDEAHHPTMQGLTCGNLVAAIHDQATMRKEISDLKEVLEKRDKTIEELQANLRSSNARLSDLKGELTESQKEEMEAAVDYGRKSAAELNTVRRQLQQMNGVADGLRRQLVEKGEEIRITQAAVGTLKQRLAERDEKIIELSERLASQSQKQTQTLDTKSMDAKILEELAVLGDICQCERHLEIIEKQREALNRLRQHLRSRPDTVTEDRIHATLEPIHHPEIPKARDRNAIPDVLHCMRRSQLFSVPDCGDYLESGTWQNPQVKADAANKDDKGCTMDTLHDIVSIHEIETDKLDHRKEHQDVSKSHTIQISELNQNIPAKNR
ncbi:unnamed protein product [Dicrocoelium dendriticum]|nr:unnamed protein product [Dicrocoelium dendriticum]